MTGVSKWTLYFSVLHDLIEVYSWVMLIYFTVLSKIYNSHFCWLVSFQKLLSKMSLVQSATKFRKDTKRLCLAYYFIHQFIDSACSDVPELYEPHLHLFLEAWVLFGKGNLFH